jgi:hypothetical protein
MKKKAVPHNRTIKQTKSKRRSVRKQRLTKPAQKVVRSRSLGHPPLRMSWCFPVYSSTMCCSTQVWACTTMNLYYWANPFTYLCWGHHKFLPIDMLIRQTWSKRMQSETDFVPQSSIKYLYYLIIRVDDLHRAESLLRE